MLRRRLPKRSNCEYYCCLCEKHKLLKGTERCRNCNHGSCWHKIITPTQSLNPYQFSSVRKLGRKPLYTISEEFPLNFELIRLLEIQKSQRLQDELRLNISNKNNKNGKYIFVPKNSSSNITKKETFKYCKSIIDLPA